MDHRIYKEIPQVGGPRELGKLQTSFNLTTFYECYLARVISFAPATKEPILLQARFLYLLQGFQSEYLNIFAIIQSTFQGRHGSQGCQGLVLAKFWQPP